MQLQGSCCCKAVMFTVESPHPHPFMQCYCSICRKTQGGGGCAVNIGALYDSLHIDGEEEIANFSPMYTNHEIGAYEPSPGKRNFCRLCGSGLWVWDPRWPELVHPFASAIDTELPVAPERTHLMVGSKASWVELRQGDKDKVFEGYPDESLAQWHQRLGLESGDG